MQLLGDRGKRNALVGHAGAEHPLGIGLILVNEDIFALRRPDTVVVDRRVPVLVRLGAGLVVRVGAVALALGEALVPEALRVLAPADARELDKAEDLVEPAFVLADFLGRAVGGRGWADVDRVPV